MVNFHLSEDSIRYDPDAERYSIRIDDYPGETGSTLAVRLIATIEDVHTAELDPLYESVDPEALDALLDSPAFARGTGARVTFEYSGYELAVDDDGRLSARPID